MRTKISTLLNLLTTFIVTAVLLFSCQKNPFEDSPPTEVPPTALDLTTKVSSSVSGFVTNENDLPVQNAIVKVGNTSTTTNRFGYFEVRNVQVVEKAATVTVINAGYFNGIKTYIASNNKAAFFRIKLLPKTNVGTIGAASGGTVTTTNNVKISLPANAVVNATTLASYTGTVNVAAKWIDPTSAELNNIMPGDLRGIDANNSLKLLTTYGMVAVELTGAGGELLQIANGKKATLTMPIPAALQANAPASIPLWFFDETNGLWKEEGSATKNGTNFIGDVSHFSFWNCDVPANFVQFNCTLRNAAGNPLSWLLVKISVVSNPYNVAFGYTDSAGYVAGAVPNNANLRLEVFSPNVCGTAIYTQTFSTNNINFSLGTVIINIPTINNATLSGTVTNCANAPVTNGRIFVKSGNIYNTYSVSNTGAFSFNRIICNGTENVQVAAEDITASQQSSTSNVIINTGSNILGNIQACGVTTDQFFNFSINGTLYSFTSAFDTLRQEVSVITNEYRYAAYRLTSQNSAILTLNSIGIGLNSNQPLIGFRTTYLNDTTFIPTPIFVNITEFGNPGQFVSGNFTGQLRRTTPPNTNYNIVCNFRIKRTY
jgi:hypothetical protein